MHCDENITDVTILLDGNCVLFVLLVNNLYWEVWIYEVRRKFAWFFYNIDKYIKKE